MEFTGERVVPGATAGGTLSEHLVRYAWAAGMAENKHVLDAACGTGYGSLILSMAARSVIGVDIDQASIDFAFNKHRPFCDTTLHVVDLEKGFRLGNFDAVVSFETIEHLSDPNPFLSSVAQNLGHDGHFIFSIPREAPSNHHKVTYKVDEIKALIGKHFNAVDWYGQTRTFISADAPLESSVFILGVATNK